MHLFVYKYIIIYYLILLSLYDIFNFSKTPQYANINFLQTGFYYIGVIMELSFCNLERFLIHIFYISENHSLKKKMMHTKSKLCFC